MTAIIVPEPLVDRAVDQLRQDLLSGVHGPGTKLKVDMLRAQYGYSSSPLREALNRLTQEGLVVVDQRRGFRVAGMSAADFADITRLRLFVDLQALEEAMEQGDDEWEVRSVAAFHRLQKVEARFPTGPLVLNAEWSARHKEFHMALLSGTTSPRLMGICSNLFDQAERYRRYSAKYRSQTRRKSDEHEAILKATMKRDKPGAIQLLTAHISRTQESIADLFEQGVLPEASAV